MRGTEYKFVQTDSAAVLSELTAKYEELTGRTLLPADPDRIFISWVADIIAQERALLNYAANQNIPSRAVGENLDALGEFIYNVKRPQAEPAECIIQFEITKPQESAVIIPKGTKITDKAQSLIWETNEDAAVPIGAVFAETKAVCKTSGTMGNGYTSGQINTLIDIDNVPYFKRCGNIDTTNSGSDTADDNTYFALMRQGLEAYSTAGPKGAYEYHAKLVSSDIQDVCAVNFADEPGKVRIYAIMSDGSTADSGTKKAIFEECNDDKVRPLTDIVEVCDPELVEFNVDLTYYVEKNAPKPLNYIAVSVSAAVDEYVRWQTAKIGRDINPSQLSWLLRDTGIKRVEIKSPVFTPLRDASNRTVPQFAKLKNVKITNGGFEDE